VILQLKKMGQDEPDDVWLDQVLFDTRNQVFDGLWEILEKKYLTKSIESGSTTAEALALRGRCYNRKGRGEQKKLKSRSGFRDLKKNQCVLCKELGHWKVDCPKAKVRRRS